MSDLLLHLVAERGHLRLMIELALLLGTVLTVGAWTAAAVRDRLRRRRAARVAAPRPSAGVHVPEGAYPASRIERAPAARPR